MAPDGVMSWGQARSLAGTVDRRSQKPKHPKEYHDGQKHEFRDPDHGHLLAPRHPGSSAEPAARPCAMLPSSGAHRISHLDVVSAGHCADWLHSHRHERVPDSGIVSALLLEPEPACDGGRPASSHCPFSLRVRTPGGVTWRSARWEARATPQPAPSRDSLYRSIE